MNFPIEIRHIETGLAKVFSSVEDLAAHLATHVKDEWEGWQALRLHPALQALDAQPAAADAPAETVEVVITPDGAVHSDQLEGAKPMADLPAAGYAPLQTEG